MSIKTSIPERNYDDMINMEHHVSTNHTQMPLMQRAAQFAPFAALTGYEESIKETATHHRQKILEQEKGTLLDD